MQKKLRSALFGAFAALYVAVTLGAWFLPAKEISESERRKLAQMPPVTVDSVLSGKFMTDFESATLDQFPMRDSVRRLKALFHYYVLGQKDNNNIYLADGSAAKLEYPLNETSLSYAAGRFQALYDSYLAESGGSITFAIVPDKGYYLAEENGYPTMDYGRLMELMREKLPWAEFVELQDSLSASDYYRTDTHWRQEKILPAAELLCKALGVTPFTADELAQNAVERPFYGVYYGQAALPMEPETLYYLTNAMINGCTVKNHETGKMAAVYDMEKLESRDLYDIFLSGATALLTIENPSAATDRELIAFRDSFGSSMVPLLLKDYRTVTVVDIRYIASSFLGSFVNFHGQDVLFLYSTLLLNQADTLK